ncbi:hypothetical protein MNEG_16305, partial [Monoraphidium neglectum]
DNPAAWRSARDSNGGELWAHLRRVVPEAARCLRSRRQLTGRHFAAADIVDDVIDWVERRLAHHSV